MSEPSPSVLITGANGFVGSRLCRKLLKEGYRVIAGVREGCDIILIENLDLQYRFGDITLPETLTEMTADVDYIIHNAGVVKVNDPLRFFEVNHQGTINILEAAAKNNRLKKFVHISSLAAAGPSPLGQPLTEESQPHPITEYGRSKLAGEQEALKFADRFNVVVIRPPGIYGPGDKEMFAFFEILNNRIRPYIGSLRRRLQLVHVDDLTQGVADALIAITESGSIYFIAEGKSYSYYMLIKHLRHAVGRAALPLYIPGWVVRTIAFCFEKAMRALGKSPMFTVEKANEILGNWEISTAKAEAELGYKSRISFSDGARETVGWYREEGLL